MELIKVERYGDKPIVITWCISTICNYHCEYCDPF